MATLTQVEDAFAAVLAGLGRELVQGRIGEGPSPAVPYAMWSLDNLELSDFPVKTIDGLDQIIIATSTPIEFLVNICGGNAMADAAKFALSFSQSQRLADLYKLCGLSGISKLQNLSAVETGNYRQRVELRVVLFAAIDLTVPAELMGTSCVRVISQEPEFDETFCVTEGECH
jgi:hypothetical protein